MRKTALFLLLWAFTGCFQASGQEKLALSLEQAINYALEYNKQLENAAISVDLAQKKINESISGFLPQADLSMDYSNYLGAEMEFSFGEGLPAQKIPFNPTSNLYLRVSQMVFSGNMIVGLQMVKIYKEMSSTNYLKTEQSLKENTIKAYQNALVSEKYIGIINENLANTRQIYENTKAMVSVGMAEKLDLDQFEVTLSTLENALKSAERQKELAYNLLRFQLGVQADTPVDLTDSLGFFIENFDITGLADKSFNLSNNLDYQVMQSQVQISGKQVSMQKMNYLPTLTGFYQHTNKLMKPEFDLSPKNVIGLNFNFPILSSGMRNSQYNQARLQYETTLNNKSLLTDQLLLQEKQLRFNLASAIEQYLNRKNNVDVTYRIYKSYRFKYEQGIASSLDLTIANNNYLQAESDYLMSIMTLLDARTALQKLLNTL
ncbi:MAG TPA: TolC family protein [Bacteroidales bacterium]|jgi:outer membrane protein TolC|nr:TolC family protein [Bacteroidales bacterium]MDX9906310.1 TolC family protein [Bacteroidales bacterium]HNQ83431.1 TolC family protein [Bacteroidales bacterium]HOX78050.1 TolC family protein [Bacteroidales bacterium]HPI84818.1 TolC family protein [Bacteroidales bacterium]